MTVFMFNVVQNGLNFSTILLNFLWYIWKFQENAICPSCQWIVSTDKTMLSIWYTIDSWKNSSITYNVNPQRQ